MGSRGIGNIDVIVRAVVDFWKSRQCVPFIFPAMGSHGAATAEGQTDVLAHYDITPRKREWAASLRSSLDVIDLGRSPKAFRCIWTRMLRRLPAFSWWDALSSTPISHEQN